MSYILLFQVLPCFPPPPPPLVMKPWPLSKARSLSALSRIPCIATEPTKLQCGMSCGLEGCKINSEEKPFG